MPVVREPTLQGKQNFTKFKTMLGILCSRDVNLRSLWFNILLELQEVAFVGSGSAIQNLDLESKVTRSSLSLLALLCNFRFNYDLFVLGHVSNPDTCLWFTWDIPVLLLLLLLLFSAFNLRVDFFRCDVARCLRWKSGLWLFHGHHVLYDLVDDHAT